MPFRFDARRAAALSIAIFTAACVNPVRADEKQYADLGRWQVTAVSTDAGFGYCSADTDNGKVQLRLATDGRGWQVGNPYYGDNGAVDGQWGFGGAAESVEFRAEGDGWASTAIDRDQLEAFKTEPSFSIDLDRGEQTWKLKGAAQAINVALECAKNRGKKQASATGPGMGKNCPKPGKYKSKNGKTPVHVTFYNGIRIPLDIYWIGYDGKLKKYHRLAPDSSVEQDTFATHPWIAVDSKGNCHGGVMMPDSSNDPEANNLQILD